jgi:hypothetical protein
MVTVYFWILVNAKNTIAGNLFVAGLPFVHVSDSTRPGAMFRVNTSTVTGQVFGWVNNSDNKLQLDAINNGASSQLTAAFVSAGTEINGCVSYAV